MNSKTRLVTGKAFFQETAFVCVNYVYMSVTLPAHHKGIVAYDSKLTKQSRTTGKIMGRSRASLTTLKMMLYLVK